MFMAILKREYCYEEGCARGAFQNWFETATNSVNSKSRDENLGFFAIYMVFCWFLSD
jgi:hypothetical protein